MGQSAQRERQALQRLPLPEEAIKLALKEIHKREDKKWVIYTDSHGSMQSIEYNIENQLKEMRST